MKLLNNLNALIARIGSSLEAPVLLVLRGWWGWSFFQTGLGKLRHLEGTTEYFRSLNIPMPHINATMAGLTECVGGALLLVGLFSRIVTLPLLGTMAVAYITAEREALVAIFNDTDKFTSAAPFLFALVCLIVLVFGPGAWSIDGVRGQHRVSAK